MRLPAILIATVLAFFFIAPRAHGAPPDALAGTAALDWEEEDLSARMMDGAHRFVERQIADAAKKRARFWNYDATNQIAWENSLEKNRERLVEIIGANWPERPRMERFGDDDAPALVADTSRYRVFQVRWSVLDDLMAEGLLVEP